MKVHCKKHNKNSYTQVLPLQLVVSCLRAHTYLILTYYMKELTLVEIDYRFGIPKFRYSTPVIPIALFMNFTKTSQLPC